MGKHRITNLKSKSKNNGFDFDYCLERCVVMHNLRIRSRLIPTKDQVHFLLIFWKKNRKYFRKFKSLTEIGQLFNMHHSNITYYVGRVKDDKNRKKSNEYEANTILVGKTLRSLMCQDMVIQYDERVI